MFFIYLDYLYYYALVQVFYIDVDVTVTTVFIPFNEKVVSFRFNQKHVFSINNSYQKLDLFC